MIGNIEFLAGIRGARILLYKVEVCLKHNPEKQFEINCWIDKRPESKHHLFELVEEHLHSRSITGFKVLRVRPIRLRDHK